ncbi:phosphatidylglycerol lysyltransferase [Pacificibacter maritimus]|uniref:Phosphatidylglycerol lysyltransferase n=1 Tax=Pacificibacter maritimus TaxID=762213 RepID=A0A3N4VEG5_9RHOB|nr:phosphatidylglycerol lysyltransferase domain-containing protein [Pacificibacter maritimus]RPE71324.1 phosphatidylglycerol lysyltransferase [Pacificibacter maritimus]
MTLNSRKAPLAPASKVPIALMRHSVITSTDPETSAKIPPQDTPEKSTGLNTLAIKQVLPLAMTLLIAWLLWDKVANLDVSAILATVSNVTPRQWVLAGLATAGSFWAVGKYDSVLHAQLGTGISRRSARRSGIAAIGLSQSLGFGALTGTLIRWRMLPELTLWQAARLSGAVALSFLAGWAVVSAAAVLLLHPDIPWVKPLAILAIALAGGMAAISVFPPAFMARLPWPSLRTMGTVVLLAAIDTILAGATLYILLPPQIDIAASQLISAYLFALGAGLVGATPGGIGPFEAMLASLLPTVPLEPLLGAVVAYRIVYYAFPAALSAVILLIGPYRCNLSKEAQITKTKDSPYLTPQLEVQLFSAPRAETNLLRTRDFSLLTATSGQHLALAAPIGQSLVVLSDPLVPKTRYNAVLKALSQAARAKYRMPVIYKCGARMAGFARKSGWKVVPTADEAWVVPAEFTVEGSKRRQLRRVLRKAQDAGISIKEGGRVLPLDDMDHVAKEWRSLRGGERGFSMGTYDRDYITCQRVFLAYQDDVLVAFITLHETRTEMTLDLMRNTQQAPDGTIQMLIVAAIEAAAAYGCPRLSLAAVPWAGKDSNYIISTIRKKFLQKSGAQGLKQFKSAFGPNWETLYMVAPSGLALVVGAMDILRRVTAPPRAPRGNSMRASKFATHGTLRLFHRKSRK